jgi:predicted phage-related endonuclease
MTSRAADPRGLDWWERRMAGFGGSDAPAVVGISRYQTLRGIVEEKGRQTLPDMGDAESLRLRLGRELEPILRVHAQELAHERGLIGNGSRVRSSAKLHRSSSAPWMIYNADGFAADALVELKTDEWGRAGFAPDDQDPALRDHPTQGLPPAYYVQVQHGLVTTRKRRALVLVLVGLHERRLFAVIEDAETQELLVDSERDAWAMVEAIRARLAKDAQAEIDDLLPPVDGSEASTEWLKRRYPADTGEMLSLTAEQEMVIAALRSARRTLARAKEADSYWTNQAKDLIGEHAGVISSLGDVTWKRSRDSEPKLVTEWEGVAKAYRTLLESLLAQGDATARGTLRDYGLDPDDAKALDVLVSMHSETVPGKAGSRRFLVPDDWTKGEA